MRLASWLGLTMWTVLIGGCAPDPGSAPAPRESPGVGNGIDRQAAVELYARHCAACHGTDGHGDGPAAEFLFPKPRAFLDSPLRFATTGLGAIESTIRDGIPRSAMLGFGGVLSEEEIRALARHVAEMTSRGASSPYPPRTPSRLAMSKPPMFNPTLVEYGATLYRSMACINCHGPTGRGDGPEILTDSLGRPVRSADLASGVYKSGPRPEDLYRTIVLGVPGTPMTPYEKLLIEERPDGTKSDLRVWALVAYIQSLASSRFEGVASGGVLRVADVEEAMLENPEHEGWVGVEQMHVSLHPLWSRIEETATISVAAVRAGDRIGVRLWWNDPTCDVNQDNGQFPDGVAIMFAQSDDVPPLPMGIPLEHSAETRPVVIWHWKASRQFDASRGHWRGVDAVRALPEGGFHLFGPPPSEEIVGAVRPGPVPPFDQDLRLDDPLFQTATAVGNIHANPALLPRAALKATALGFGTLTYQPVEAQDLESVAVWAHGHWFVAMVRSGSSPREQDVEFAPGKRIPFALGLWNGSKGDRDGIKLISGWHWLVMDDAPHALPDTAPRTK